MNQAKTKLHQVDDFLPYQDEPIASSDAESNESSGESFEDADGLTPRILALIFEGNVDVDSWYSKILFSFYYIFLEEFSRTVKFYAIVLNFLSMLQYFIGVNVVNARGRFWSVQMNSGVATK